MAQRGKPNPKPKGKRYTDADRARAVEVLKADGLTAAAKAIGCAKATVLAWAKAADVDPSDYADRSTDQNTRAAVAAVAARRATMVKNRAALSDELIGKLAPKAAALIADRLDEEARYAELIAEAEERLELAVIGLLACGDPPEDADVDTRKTFAEARKTARAAVADARLILDAYRSGRVKVPELVGVLTRSVTDHLALEGEAQDAAAASGSFAVTITAPRPPRRAPAPGVVTLDPVADPGVPTVTT
jgi:transposase-like protein